MSELTILVVASGYTVNEPEQILYQVLEGGMGRYALDMVGGANRLVNVTWVVSGTEYDDLRTFFLENVGNDCEPFDISLIIDGAAPQVYSDVRQVEDSFKLDSVNGGVFTCSAQLEVPPSQSTTDWPDAGWTFDWPESPRKLSLHPQQSGYSMTVGSEIVSANEDSPASTYRRSYLNAARRVPVRWFTEAAGYVYLQQAYRNYVFTGGEPFLIDLIMDSSELTTHKACFVPGTFGLAEQKGDSYTVEATLEVEPAPYTGPYVQHPQSLITPPPETRLTQFHPSEANTYRPMVYLDNYVSVTGIGTFLTNVGFDVALMATATDPYTTVDPGGGDDLDVDMATGSGLAVIDPAPTGSSDDMIVEFRLGSDEAPTEIGIAYTGLGPPLFINSALDSQPVAAYWNMFTGQVNYYGGEAPDQATATYGDIVAMVIVSGHLWFFKNGTSLNGSTGYNGAGSGGKVCISNQSV